MSMIVQTLSVIESDREVTLEEAVAQRFEDGEKRLRDADFDKEEVYVGVS